MAPSEADSHQSGDHESDEKCLYCSMTSCHECERHACD